TDQLIERLLKEMRAEDFVSRTSETALLRQLASEPDTETSYSTPQRLPRLALLFESQGLAALQREAHAPKPKSEDGPEKHFGAAFTCWNSLADVWMASSTAIGSNKSALDLESEM